MAGTKWWKTSWKRIGLVAALLFVGFWLADLLGAHLVLWYQAWQFGRDNPATSLMPTRLSDTSVADLREGMTVDRFGYSVRVPWSKTKAIKDFKIMASFGFEDGSSLLIFDPANRKDMVGSYLADADARKAFASLVGEEGASSHYGYAKTELSESPNDVSIFASRRQNARALVLLPLKSIDIPKETTVIYVTSGEVVRGFQFGDPGKVPTFVELLLFDGKDRGLELIFKGPKGGTRPVLTQAQLNAIVASVQVPQ